MIILLLFLILVLGIGAVVYLKFYFSSSEREEVLPAKGAIKSRVEGGKADQAQLNVLLSASKISKGSNPEKVLKPKSVATDEDKLDLLTTLEKEIGENLKILDEMMTEANDFGRVVAAGELAKLQVAGKKFATVVKNKRQKAAELKKTTDMSSTRINEFIIKSFTVEMSVMNDLLDQASYVTVISWEDLVKWNDQFSDDVKRVQMNMKK